MILLTLSVDKLFTALFTKNVMQRGATGRCVGLVMFFEVGSRVERHVTDTALMFDFRLGMISFMLAQKPGIVEPFIAHITNVRLVLRVASHMLYPLVDSQALVANFTLKHLLPIPVSPFVPL